MGTIMNDMVTVHPNGRDAFTINTVPWDIITKSNSIKGIMLDNCPKVTDLVISKDVDCEPVYYLLVNSDEELFESGDWKKLIDYYMQAESDGYRIVLISTKSLGDVVNYSYYKDLIYMKGIDYEYNEVSK